MNNLVEQEPKLNPNFIIEAGDAALAKIADIHQPTFQKHSFVRFGPLVIEHGLRQSSDSGIADLSIDRLDGVLRRGILSSNLAGRIRVPISRNWLDSFNKSRVSLGRENTKLENMFIIGTSAALKNWPIRIPRENVYTILTVNKYPYRNAKLDEAFSILRVAPRFFRAIVFIDGSGEETSPRLREQINFGSSTTQETADMIVKKMLEVNKDKPDRCVPVYGLSGDLYWPKSLSYDEIKELVQEKQRIEQRSGHIKSKTISLLK